MTSETPFKDGGAPDWFDATQHWLTPAGIFRRSDNALLAEDGLPASLALRAAEARAAAEAEAAEIRAAEEAAEADRAAKAAAKAAAKNLKTEAPDGDQ